MKAVYCKFTSLSRNVNLPLSSGDLESEPQFLGCAGETIGSGAGAVYRDPAGQVPCAGTSRDRPRRSLADEDHGLRG